METIIMEPYSAKEWTNVLNNITKQDGLIIFLRINPRTRIGLVKIVLIREGY